MMSDGQKKPKKSQGAIAKLWRQIGYSIDRAFKTDGRRLEFEHAYARHGDHFGYLAKPHEITKYEPTLSPMHRWRRGSGSAPKVGCSVGVFTAMIARDFERLVAGDIASEALARAEGQVAGAGQRLLRPGALLTPKLGARFDAQPAGVAESRRPGDAS